MHSSFLIPVHITHVTTHCGTHYTSQQKVGHKDEVGSAQISWITWLWDYCQAVIRQPPFWHNCLDPKFYIFSTNKYIPKLPPRKQDRRSAQVRRWINSSASQQFWSDGGSSGGVAAKLAKVITESCSLPSTLVQRAKIEPLDIDLQI